jgi:ubiquinol-cytochrome c reductase cytochrome b subunit
MRAVFIWLEDRTGYRRLLVPIARRVLPKGPGWWRTTASCLVWLLIVQVVTGALLMTTYSPSANSAWASIHYIESSAAGTFIRGLHYFAAQAMIILFGIHIVRVLLAGAFRAPRELIWISGLILTPLILVWAITGNPLSGTQEGFAQIDVEGHILGSTPIVGGFLRDLLIGGEQPGNLTLTHLYFLHVAFLPAIVLILLVLHITQIYRHGLSGEEGLPHNAAILPYWPYQTARNMVVFGALLAVLSILAWRRGAPLGAPALADLPHAPRPEWYFLWLFELRRYFSGDWEFIATLIVPFVILASLVALPFVDRLCRHRTSVFLRTLVVSLLAIGWGTLTAASLDRDRKDEDFQNSRARSVSIGERARMLADRQGIPAEGAAALLRDDPKTQGPILFERHCAGCHAYLDERDRGIVAQKPSAPNLFGFGTRDWVAGFLDPDRVRSVHYFGNTKFADGDMAKKIEEIFAAKDAKRSALCGQLAKVSTAISAEAGLSSQVDRERRDTATIAEGRKLLVESFACTECHKFHDKGELGTAPDLTGYGSSNWLSAMIANPQSERFYAKDHNDRMPAFAESSTAAHLNLLSQRELSLIVKWLRGEWPERPADLGSTALYDARQ